MSERDSAFPFVDATSGAHPWSGVPLATFLCVSFPKQSQTRMAQLSGAQVKGGGRVRTPPALGWQTRPRGQEALPWCSQTLSSVLAFCELKISVIKPGPPGLGCCYPLIP